MSATKNAWIPAVSESSITYDANGNLTADARGTYTYDEDGARQRVDGAPQSGVPRAKRRVRKAGAPWATDEQNRLITMEETTAAATAGFPDTTITFKYDYLGRRVEKKVVRGTVTESHLRFVWRGWLLARISPKSSTALRNIGTGTGIVRCACPCAAQMQATLQGVAPASSARDEFCETCGLRLFQVSLRSKGQLSTFLHLVLLCEVCEAGRSWE